MKFLRKRLSGERLKKLTLEELVEMARAMDCELSVSLVPRGGGLPTYLTTEELNKIPPPPAPNMDLPDPGQEPQE
jgi:hypothetical protein